MFQWFYSIVPLEILHQATHTHTYNRLVCVCVLCCGIMPPTLSWWCIQRRHGIMYARIQRTESNNMHTHWRTQQYTHQTICYAIYYAFSPVSVAIRSDNWMLTGIVYLCGKADVFIQGLYLLLEWCPHRCEHIEQKQISVALSKRQRTQMQRKRDSFCNPEKRKNLAILSYEAPLKCY